MGLVFSVPFQENRHRKVVVDSARNDVQCSGKRALIFHSAVTKMKFHFYLYIFLLGTKFAEKVVSQFASPSIVGAEDPLVVTAGTSWTIKCFGGRPLDWVVKSGESEKIKRVDEEIFGENIYNSVLKIVNSTYLDTGQYICRFANYSNEENSSDSVNVFVFDPDHFFIPPQKYVDMFENSPQAVIPCIITNPNISVTLWKQVTPVDKSHLTNATYDPARGFIISYPTNYFHGSFRCKGRHNESIKEEITGRIHLQWRAHVKNLPTPQVSVIRDRILTNENFSITCNITFNVKKLRNVAFQWYFPNPNRHDETVKCTLTEIPGNETHSYCHASFDVNFAVPEDTGNYTCSVKANSYLDMRNSIFINITGRTKPTILFSNLRGSVHNAKGSDVNLTCIGDGIPKPKISWYKDNSTLTFNTPGITMLNNNTQMIISRITEDNNGQYSCMLENTEGNMSDVTFVVIEEPQGGEILLSNDIKDEIVWAVCSTFALCFLGVSALFIFRKRKRYQKFAELQKMLFEQGDIKSLDPDAPLAEQVELLPYDRRWEFCPNKLKLGKTLGQGAFGRVVKAKAYGFLTDENEPIIVAIKLLKERTDLSQQKALLQELKIMIHLGRHVNVLNLLGACTKRIDKGELMVIVEYCSRGNLRHFLLNHRDVFINQVDPETENVINGGSFLFILDEDSSSSLQNYKNASLIPLLKNLSQGDIDTGRNARKTDQFSTTDLVCLAWQIARGMEYISSKQLLHRDLAARNILLTKDYVVKICDFGLAKDLYNYSVYKKKANGPLPIKWMAIESLRDKIFSTQSDVWSFGIVLWELFTLGGNPYPGVEIDHEFFQKLLDGYRLAKPDFASKDIYLAMRECWNEKPNNRPNFKQLVTTIGNLLDEKLNARYANLDGAYLCGSNSSDVTQDYILMSEIGDTEHMDSNSDNKLTKNDRNNYLEMDNLRPEENKLVNRLRSGSSINEEESTII